MQPWRNLMTMMTQLLLQVLVRRQQFFLARIVSLYEQLMNLKLSGNDWDFLILILEIGPAGAVMPETISFSTNASMGSNSSGIGWDYFLSSMTFGQSGSGTDAEL